MVKSFAIAATSDRLWNIQELVRYLSENQKGHINLTVEPEAIDLEMLGIYRLLDAFDFETVTINTRNPFESHERCRINLIPNHWFLKIETVDQGLHQWNREKIFFALFGRPTASRLSIAAYLQAHHASQTHLHFSADLRPDDRVQFELDKALCYSVNHIESIGRLLKQLPLLLSTSDRYTAFLGYDFSDPLTQIYRDILIDVVVESHVAGRTFFPTEKTLRPMWLKKPFVVFASANFLDYLHQMGFRTFSDFWPEDYDGYEAGDRLEKILSLLDHISKLSLDRLEQMYWDMQYTLDHNYKLLVNQSYNTQISPIDYDN